MPSVRHKGDSGKRGKGRNQVADLLADLDTDEMRILRATFAALAAPRPDDPAQRVEWTLRKSLAWGILRALPEMDAAGLARVWEATKAHKPKRGGLLDAAAAVIAKA